MKKEVLWKRAFWAVVLFLLCALLLAEFGGMVLFVAGVFGLSALWVLGRAWWEARRERLRREEAETALEEAEEAAVRRRQAACREARYAPEERARLEEHLRRELGSPAAWDREEGGAPVLDAALIPPTERLPFWKAATVGAGACVLEAGDCSERMELVMALPPDWEPSEAWPASLLRSAARRCLMKEGYMGYFVYRGLAFLSAGFAGAVADDLFPGLPELLPAAISGEGRVKLYWLVPLLKPELDSLLRRGQGNLERRLPAARPWADPKRRPWAGGDWFREDIAPFTWSEHEGRFCLGLETGTFCQELFLRAGLWGTGGDWERLAREFLRRRRPEDGPFVEYACEEGLFFAASEDREILEQLALGLSDLLREDWTAARRLLVPEEYER